jgi:hypothetical protein
MNHKRMETKPVLNATENESFDDLSLLYPPYPSAVWKYRRIIILQAGCSCQVHPQSGGCQRHVDREGQDVKKNATNTAKK